MALLSALVTIFCLLNRISASEDDSNADGLFTSNTDLQVLLWTEAELVRGLHRYLHEEEQRIDKIRQFVSEYEAFQDAAETSNPEKFVSNPLNSYRLIKKMTSDWKEVTEVMNQSPAEEFMKNITLQRESIDFKWPSDEDLSGAAVALIRLQDTYHLNPEDLANGNLNGVDYGAKLSAHDCFELGRQAYNVADHYHSDMWMKQALKKLSEEQSKGSKTTVSKSDILEYMAFSAYVQGNMRKALKLTIDLLEVDPQHPRAAGNKEYYLNAIETEGGKFKKRGEDGLGDTDDTDDLTIAESKNEVETSEERIIYAKLCRGENTMSERYRSQLKCHYEHGFHPFLKLGPVKAEEAFLQPKIVVYHDVLSDDEIKMIKSMATPRFKRATVQNYKTGELETANYRISKTAWLKSDENEAIKRIYRRVGHVTGLNMDTSEDLQVSNYGIGGHYEPHFDFARREEKNAFASLGTGNRIATWLFYESDVEQGGATVFPHLGIGLWPKKGSAVFWYNLHRNGEGDDLTRHAACPVLAGNKWVSNFWIHERGQEFTRPCTTSPFE